MLCRIFIVAIVAFVPCLAAGVQGQNMPEPDDEPTERPARDKSTGSKDAPAGGAKPAGQKRAPKPDAAKAARADEAALRDALKALAKSLQTGEPDGIKQVVYAANPTERKMVDAMAAMAVQIAGLYKVSAKAFGEDEARRLTGDVAAELTRIDDAEVSIDGDTATVRYREPDAGAAAPVEGEAAAADAPAAMVLKRVDGRWRVLMSELSKDATPEGIEQRLADLDAQTRVIEGLAKEVAQGKYRDAEQAVEAWHAKMLRALTPGKPPGADEPAGEKGRGPEGEKAGSDEARKAVEHAPETQAPRQSGKPK